MKNTRNKSTIVLAMACLMEGAGAGCGIQQPVREANTAVLQTDTPKTSDQQWLNYGGNQWNERHADLTQITRKNVAKLVPRRVLQFGQVPYSLSASPLVIDDILYEAASNGVVQAFGGYHAAASGLILGYGIKYKTSHCPMHQHDNKS